MNRKSSIYANPIIPADLYFAKLLDVHLDNGEKPFLWACLLTGPSYREAAGLRLASMIYRSPKSEVLVANFRKTFRVEDDTLDAYLAAIGRWGCVSVFPKKYQAEQFSCVIYVTQNADMQKTSRLFEERDSVIGGIEWPDHTDPSIA